MSTATSATGPRAWLDILSWRRRLERFAAGPVPGRPGLAMAAHLHGLFRDHPKLYVLCRTGKGTFIGYVASFADGPAIALPGDIEERARFLDGLDIPRLVADIAGTHDAFANGHRTRIGAFMRHHRQDLRPVHHPRLGRLVLYPLRFPTLTRGFGFDPLHPPYAVRRGWMAAADLARRAGVDPTREMVDAYLDAEEHRARQALASAAGMVDRDILALLAQATQYGQDSYHFYAATGERGVVRRQAARAYPAFARAIAEIPALRRAVDRRRPLVPALARTFMVDEATVRCFHTFGYRVFPDLIEYLLLFLQDIDGSLCPGRRAPTAAQWAAFAVLAREINALASFVGGMDGRVEALHALLRGFDGDWAALYGRVGGVIRRPEVPATAVPLTPQVHEAFHPRQRAQEEERIAHAVAWEGFQAAHHLPWSGESVRDALRAFAYAVCLPLAARDSGREDVVVDRGALRLAEAVATRFVLRGRAFEQVVAFAQAFHEAIGALFPGVSLRNVRGARLAWSRPSPPVGTPNGIAVVPLGSNQDLVEEGAALDNCLPLYAVHCAVEGRRVLSLRCRGQRIAAAEIEREAEGRPWHLRQIEGPGNHRAAPEALEAARWYLAWLNRQGPAVELPADPERGDTDVLKALCGYDWRDPAALQAMWTLWSRPPRGRPVLPKGALKKGLAGLRALPEFNDLRRTLADG